MSGVSEESYRLIVETIPGLVAVMTPAGELEHVNGQVLDYFGRTLYELKHWGTSDAVHPGDRGRALAAWQKAVETEQPFPFNGRLAVDLECRHRDPRCKRGVIPHQHGSVSCSARVCSSHHGRRL